MKDKCIYTCPNAPSVTKRNRTESLEFYGVVKNMTQGFSSETLEFMEKKINKRVLRHFEYEWPKK